MIINSNVVKQFLDVELLDIKRVYIPTSDGKLMVKFITDSTFTFNQVKQIINLLHHLDKYTKWGQVDTIIKTSVEVLSNEVSFTMWIDDINIDSFYGGKKESIEYGDMLKSIKNLVV